MYIANSAAVTAPRGILAYLPPNLRRYMYNVNLSEAYEIHMGSGLPLIIYFPDGRYCVNRRGMLTRNPSEAVTVTRENISEALELITGASVYSVKSEICNGFITVPGGHRVGITGSAVIRNGKISFVKDISALNFRLAGEMIGAADKVIDIITDGKSVKNTLFISPPGAGKTTILRDSARQLSMKGFRVSIVDERHEIAAMQDGVSAFDLGLSCDVLTGINKADGMMMMLRSMSPEVIITDELGTAEDFEAVNKMLSCGVSIIASVHGRNLEQAKLRCGELLKYFEVTVTLGKYPAAGTIEDVTVK